MEAATILKSTLPVEPPLREMNSFFVTFNQKCNFYGSILTFKGIYSLLSEARMLKRFFARKRLNPDFYGSKFGVFWTGDSLIVNLKAPNPKRHVYQSEHDFWTIKRAIRTKIATCGLAEEAEKRKKAGEESHKTAIFHHHVEAPFPNRSAPNLVSL